MWFSRSRRVGSPWSSPSRTLSPSRRPCACPGCGCGCWHHRAAPAADQSECRAEWPGGALAALGGQPVPAPGLGRPSIQLIGRCPVPGLLSSQSAQCFTWCPSCQQASLAGAAPWGEVALKAALPPRTRAVRQHQGSGLSHRWAVLRAALLPADPAAPLGPAQRQQPCHHHHVRRRPPTLPIPSADSWAALLRRRVEPKAWQGPRAGRRLPRTVRLNSLDAPISPPFPPPSLSISSLQVIRRHCQVWLSG